MEKPVESGFCPTQGPGEKGRVRGQAPAQGPSHCFPPAAEAGGGGLHAAGHDPGDGSQLQSVQAEQAPDPEGSPHDGEAGEAAEDRAGEEAAAEAPGTTAPALPACPRVHRRVQLSNWQGRRRSGRAEEASQSRKAPGACMVLTVYRGCFGHVRPLGLPSFLPSNRVSPGSLPESCGLGGSPTAKAWGSWREESRKLLL